MRDGRSNERALLNEHYVRPYESVEEEIKEKFKIVR